jgi:ABC-type nitrate/sulfonate/bicarbonate transport system substrate-binding protein
MMKRLLAAVVTIAFAVAAIPDTTRAEDTKLAVIVFPGVPNLPIFAAQAKGFFAKRGLDIDVRFTPNSEELRNGLAEGRYQIAHSAIDNAFALKDKANVDIAVVNGGDNSFNHLIVQPEIMSLADIKGKTVVVDAVNTAYAFQLYEMLRQNGLAYIEGVHWTLNIANKPEAVALMIERLKLSDEIAAQAYDVATNPKEGFDRDAALNLEGVKNVLGLRAQFEGGTPAAPDKYIELSYYRKAMAGL